MSDTCHRENIIRPDTSCQIRCDYPSPLPADRVEARILISVGLLIYALFTFLMSRLDPRVTFAMIAALTLLRGAGLGIMFPPWMTRSLKSVALEQSRMASGMLNVCIGVGASFGIAITATLLERYQIFRQTVYTEEQWLTSEGTQTAVLGFQQVALKLGQFGGEAQVTAHSMLQRLWVREALIGAFSDCFMILGLLALATIIPALFLRERQVG
ncbi:hypothetical protein C2W62_30355 [Candidatus Entotheonella serta]|nr:hypothetical protein C2W62_30355 [Candidatus Entotheonella serta]